MNHWSTSPIGETNETVRKITPNFDDSVSSMKGDSKQSSMNFKCLMTEDLQKIKRSNHSGHQAQDLMGDTEHDGIIKGMLYPGLENSTNDEMDFDFFDEDYQNAQEAVRDHPPTRSTPGVASLPNSSNSSSTFNNLASDSSAQLQNDNSYYASYYSSMGRPYSDLSGEKLRR